MPGKVDEQYIADFLRALYGTRTITDIQVLCRLIDVLQIRLFERESLRK